MCNFRFEEGNVLLSTPDIFTIDRILERTASSCSEENDGGRGVKVNIDVPVYIHQKVAGCLSLKRVMHHLITNAIKFSPEKGIVRIIVDSQKRNEDFDPTAGASTYSVPVEIIGAETYTFSITNSTLQPVDMDEIRKCFHSRYYSVRDKGKSSESTNTLSDVEGLGLGLYICHNLCKIMEGSLTCCATDEEVTFTFAVNLKLVQMLKVSNPSTVYHSAQSILVNTGNFRRGTTKDSFNITEFSSQETDAIQSLASVVEKLRNTETTADGAAYIARRPNVVASIDLEGNSKPRVLVVDDSTICQRMMVKVLSKYNCDCDVAGNGRVAVNMLIADPLAYNVILMDLRMPIMDGLTATKYCREELNLKTPIIVLSAEVGKEIFEKVMQSGASSFLEKPAQASDVIREFERFGVFGNSAASAVD